MILLVSLWEISVARQSRKLWIRFYGFFFWGWGGLAKTIQRFSTGFQGKMVDLGKPKDILLHTLSALGNHPGLDGSVSIFSSPKFFRKTKKIFSPLSPYSATKGPSTMGRRWVAWAWPRALLRAVLHCAQLWISGGLNWCVCVIDLLFLQLPVLHMLPPSTTSTTSLTATLRESE